VVASLPPAAATSAGTAPPATAPAAGQPPAPGPQFDIVRVNPAGGVVIAGRATPGSQVAILKDGQKLGTVRADGRGEWAYASDQQLPPGSHELSLSSQLPGRTAVVSADVVVLVVAEPKKDVAGRPSEKTGQPLAMLVPREGNGASTVLQKPTTTASLDPEAPVEATAAVPAPATAAAPAATPPATGATASAPATAGPSDATAAPAAPAATAGGAATGPVVTTVDPSGTAAQVAPDKTPGRGIVNRGLALDSVDYDAAGNVSIGGRAPPQARLQIYVDNKLIGSSVGEASGRWRLTPQGMVAQGPHTLRIDEVSPDGRVIARVESPFARAEPVVAQEGDTVVVVQPGASLWRIARHSYGTGMRYTVIYEANRTQIRNPDLIYPGQVFVVPPTQAGG